MEAKCKNVECQLIVDGKGNDYLMLTGILFKKNKITGDLIYIDDEDIILEITSIISGKSKDEIIKDNNFKLV